MSENYWVCIHGHMKFFTWQGGNYKGQDVDDYINQVFKKEIEAGPYIDFEYGQLLSVKDYRITPKKKFKVVEK